MCHHRVYIALNIQSQYCNGSAWNVIVYRACNPAAIRLHYEIKVYKLFFFDFRPAQRPRLEAVYRSRANEYRFTYRYVVINVIIIIIITRIYTYFITR